jgi:hypothetical protein
VAAKTRPPEVRFRESTQAVRDRLEAAGEDLTPPRERAAREALAPRTPAQIQADMDPQEWACRSQEHSWAQLLPGATEIPDGMRVTAAGRGQVRFEMDCLHGCGRFREELTDGRFTIISRRYGTRPGHRHVVVHRDETMSKAQMREGTYGSNKKLLQQAVREARAAAREAARAAG